MDALRTIGLAVMAVSVSACTEVETEGPGDTQSSSGAEQSPEAVWEADAMDWRERRLEKLNEPYGWLSLVGLDFIGDGQWRVGSGNDADIVVPAGPGLWGVLHIDGETAVFEPAPETDVEIDGEKVERGRMYPAPGEETVFASTDKVRFQIINRDGDLAVRTRWAHAETRTGFTGLDYFDFDPGWRIEARFERNAPDSTIPIANVLGDLIDEPNLGRAIFEVDGREFSLEAVGDENDEELFFIFADRTSGHETYGLGRFLYADAPVDGRIVLDFNRAYNPPCVFTEYSTCPLPPPENRLDVRVEAGELMYEGHGGLKADDVRR